MQYLSDPSAIVQWKDVIEVIYSAQAIMTNVADQKTQCPICMEPAGFMVAPRVTKCGHLFCYACLLQYLDFEKQYAWKKCPLCSDPVYKRDIRKARIIFDQIGASSLQESEDLSLNPEEKIMQFRLIARNKSNIVAKHKIHIESIDTSQHGLDNLTIMEAQLPTVNQAEYSGSRVRTGDETYIRQLLADDLV